MKRIYLLTATLLSASPFPAAAGSSAAKTTAPAPYRFQPAHASQRISQFYSAYWGVDSLIVKTVESGELIRFSYRVVSSDKAAPLHNKKAEPFLIDSQARVKLVIPSLEKVGQLRQSEPPQDGKAYWMAFSNKGRKVKPGDRVDIVIGTFRAQGLIVE